MKTTTFFFFFAALLAIAGLAFGQAAPTQTTTAAAVAYGDQVVYLSSATGVTGPGSLNQATTELFIDGELMRVSSVTGTTVGVLRAQDGTKQSAHVGGALVWIGAPGYFGQFDPAAGSACTSTAQAALPMVVPPSGRVWNCLSGQWVEATSTYRALTSVSATPGTVRVVRGEITSYSTQTSGNLVGVRGAVTAATGANLTGGYFYGTQGKAITGTATINVGSGDFSGVYGQLDVTGGTITSGHVAPLESNLYGAQSGTHGAAVPIDLLYMEHAAGGVIRDAIHLFGKMDYVLNFESNSDLGYAVSTTCQPAAISTTGAIRIIVDGTEKFIPLVAKGTCTGNQ